MKLEIAIRSVSEFDDFGFEEPFVRVALLNEDGSKKAVSDKSHVGKKSRGEGVYTWDEPGSILHLEMGEEEPGSPVRLQFTVYCQTNGVTNQYEGVGNATFDAFDTPVDATVHLLQEEGIELGKLHVSVGLAQENGEPAEHQEEQSFSRAPLERGSSVGRYLQFSDEEDSVDQNGDIDDIDALFEDNTMFHDALDGAPRLAATAPLPLRHPLPTKQHTSHDMGRRPRLGTTLAESTMDTTTEPDPLAAGELSSAFRELIPSTPATGTDTGFSSGCLPAGVSIRVAGELWLPDLSGALQQLRSLQPRAVSIRVPSIICSGAEIKHHKVGLATVRASLSPISTSTVEVAAVSVEKLADSQLLRFSDDVLQIPLTELMLRSRYFKEGGCPRMRIELVVAARVQAFAEVHLPSVLALSGHAELSIRLTPVSRNGATYTALMSIEEHGLAAPKTTEATTKPVGLRIQIGELGRRSTATEGFDLTGLSVETSLTAVSNP